MKVILETHRQPLVWISSMLCSLQHKTWPASAPNEFGLAVGDPPQAVGGPPKGKQVSSSKTIIFNFAFIHKSKSQVFTYVAYKKNWIDKFWFAKIITIPKNISVIITCSF